LCKPGFAAAQRFLTVPERHFGLLALDELTDLAADGGQHIEQLLIGLPDLAAEKLDYAQGFPPSRMGKAKAACSSSRFAMGPRGKFSSETTS
jgi:hypothetical protein